MGFAVFPPGDNLAGRKNDCSDLGGKKMSDKERRLLAKAKAVLKSNWRRDHTIPSPRLYPHQWSWDAAFVAIGYARYQQKKAEQELLSLFEGQWTNGMLPHIIFRYRGEYFPGPEFWQTDLSPCAPRIRTSGITQPPVHAIAVWYVYSNAKDKNNARSFLEEMFPRLCAFHRYLLTARDPEQSGLVTIFHPWESGLDNSVRWDDALQRIKLDRVPQYKRIDTRRVSPDERPTKEAYDRYVYLVQLMKEERYNEERVYERIPFKIKDIVFSSILYVANKCLLEIAQILGEKDEEIRSWMKRTETNYFTYFCPGTSRRSLAFDFDLVSRKAVEKRTAASLVPIYTGLLSPESAGEVVAWMKHAHFCRENCTHRHPVATSISMEEAEFNPINYWRGPVWININWMLCKGLKASGFHKDADTLRQAIIGLVDEHGFYEYYNPMSGKGLGGDNFSVTSASRSPLR